MNRNLHLKAKELQNTRCKWGEKRDGKGKHKKK